MPDVKDSRESAPSTTHDTQLTQTTRYPERERRPPKHLDDYVTDLDEDQYMSNVAYFYRVSSFPQSYKEAISLAESENWKKAMSEEMDSLRENKTFTLTTLLEGRKSVGGPTNKFAQSPTDHCVYVRQVDKDIVIIVVWVDDLGVHCQ